MERHPTDYKNSRARDRSLVDVAERCACSGREPREELVEIGDVQPAALAPHESIGTQPPEHQRDRLPRRANQFAEQAARHRGRAASGSRIMTLRETHERCDQPLLDGQHRMLSKLHE